MLIPLTKSWSSQCRPLRIHDVPHVAVELGALQIVQTWTAVTTGANRKPLRLLEMSRCLLNIAKRSLPKLILSGVGLASKDTAGRVVYLACFQSST